MGKKTFKKVTSVVRRILDPGEVFGSPDTPDPPKPPKPPKPPVKPAARKRKRSGRAATLITRPANLSTPDIDQPTLLGL